MKMSLFGILTFLVSVNVYMSGGSVLRRVIRQTQGTAGNGTSSSISHPQCRTYQDGVRVLISGHECHVAVDTIGRQICYNHWFRSRRCCLKCLQLKNSRNRGCEYGDRSSECATLQARQCYINRNRQICCDTCRRLRNNAAPNCEFGDMATSCALIPRGLCAIAENRRICCQACHRVRDTNNPTCPYGDQSSQCFQIRPMDCYSERTQEICCQTCARLRTSNAECPYGNKATQCEILSAGDCYSDGVRNSCCQTCQTHLTGVAGCEYGDRPVFFATPAGRMNCEAYIRVYGRSYCSEDTTSARCCQSCSGTTPGP